MTLPAIKEEFIVINTLEEGIDKLCKYGLPSFMKHNDNKWSCKVNMFVATKGASFEINGGYQNLTLKEAIQNCLENIYLTLSQLNK